MNSNDRGPTPLQVKIAPSERASENIEAWEKKRASDVLADRGDDMSDDAEAGGP